jgi:hypothetical protein
MALNNKDLKTSLLCILTLFGATTLASNSVERSSDPVAELRIPDQLPSPMKGKVFTVSPDRVSIAILDGIPCRLVIAVDHTEAANVPGPMLRNCGVVEDWANQFAAIKSDAFNKNRKLQIDSTRSYIGHSLVKKSELEIYDTRGLMKKIVELNNENKKLKSTLSEAGLSTKE